MQVIPLLKAFVLIKQEFHIKIYGRKQGKGEHWTNKCSDWNTKERSFMDKGKEPIARKPPRKKKQRQHIV